MGVPAKKLFYYSVIWLLIVLVGPSGAMEVKPLDEEMMACWQTEDGLPQSSVLSIAQTPDGYLWLATFGGLARFDGVRFTVFDTSNLPGLPGNSLIKMLVDKAGSLWLITESHELARLSDGICRSFGPADGLPSEGVSRIGEDNLNGLWVAGHKNGLWRWQDGAFVPAVISTPLVESFLKTMVTDNEGRLWLKHGDQLFNFQDRNLVRLAGPADQPNVKVIRMCSSSKGGLWIMTAEGLRTYRQGQWLAQTWPLPDIPDIQVNIKDFCEDFDGNLWIATYRDGLFRFNSTQSWRHLTVESGLTTLSTRSLFCDREGNLWVGTDGGGLMRITPRPFKMITRRDGLGIDAVHSVCQDRQGRIWFGGGTITPYWLNQGVVSAAIPYPQSSILSSVWAVLPARDGSMWIGTYRGVVARYKDRILTAYSQSEGLSVGHVHALFEDRRNTLWIGGSDGLARITGSQIVCFSIADGLSSRRISALAEDSQGRVYVGTTDGGLNRFEAGRFTVFRKGQGGLPEDNVTVLYVDKEDTVWIGTHRGGLSCFRNGSFINFSQPRGLSLTNPSPILEDDNACLWIGSREGIVRVAKQELNAFAAGSRDGISFTVFDRTDGLATTECSGVQPGACLAQDGTLWFGTSKGAAFMNPKALRDNPLPPPVVIEEVRIDDELVEKGKSQTTGRASKNELAETSSLFAYQQSSVTMLASQRRVEFRFTGLSFSAPAKVQFRYRMEGFDPDWVNAGTSRSVSYTRLGAGHYRFRVTARNNDGLWNETGASLAVIVLAPWYHTWWAISLAILAGVGLIAWFYEQRLHRLRRARALQEGFSRQLIASQEAERRRLAGELHDSLGQELLLIKNHAVLALDVPEAGRAIKDQVEEISVAAGRAIDTARAMAHALGPYELKQLGLAGAMESMIDRIADATGLEFHCQFDGLTDVLDAEQQIALYRILQESLNNVVKHAKAHEVFLEIQRSAERLTVRLQDDGCGFEIDAAGRAKSAGGHGLPGIYERAHLAGGHARIRSAPGRGTVLTLELPLRGGSDQHKEK